MTASNQVKDAADAVGRFAQACGAGPPDRVLARLRGPGGVDSLCAVEAVIGETWPRGVARELVWLTGQAGTGDTLELRAFAPAGDLMAEAVFELAARP